MDEFNISSLSEAKGEYSIRLVNILTPLILEGIKSIFNNAKTLCVQNDEYEKYLMTFQNLLSRVINWNENLIQDEVNRVVHRSKCNYLNELITSVHITQIKILTSIKLGNNCKKITLDIPSINKFIHNVYIKVSRKIYTMVYLFEEDIEPLSYQKYMRECDLIIQGCILDTIRDSIPVESILKNYLNEFEEDIEESISNSNDDALINTGDDDTKALEQTENTTTTNASTNDVKQVDTTGDLAIDTSGASNDEVKTLEQSGSEASSNEVKQIDTTGDPTTNNNGTQKDETIEKESVSQTLKFNDTDTVLFMNNNKETTENNPKDINTLEKKFNENYIKRKQEEEEEEEDSGENNTLKIGNSDIDLNNEILSLETLPAENEIELDIETL